MLMLGRVRDDYDDEQKVKIKGFSFHFESSKSVMGPHYIAGTYFPLVLKKQKWNTLLL